MKTAGMNRSLWLALFALLAAVVGAAVYKLQPLLNPQPVLLAQPDPWCDLRSGSCSARFPDGGMLTFEVEPKGIPVLTPLTLRVSVDGIETDAVEVDFAGVDMNMGYNRAALSPVGPGSYQGNGMLPICVRNRMSWEARVLLHGPRGLLAAPFRFETSRNAPGAP